MKVFLIFFDDDGSSESMGRLFVSPTIDGFESLPLFEATIPDADFSGKLFMMQIYKI